VLEQKLPLALELSVVVARSASGDVVQLPVQQNLHRGGILAVTQVPAPDASAALQAQAAASAAQLATDLHYVGVLCVEFFVTTDGQLVANEMAPRPHNSGHWSIDGADISQFDLQVRTLCGLPLVAPRQHSAAVMLNLLGDLWFRADGRERAPPWAAVLACRAPLHLYGSSRGAAARWATTITADAAARAASRCAAARPAGNGRRRRAMPLPDGANPRRCTRGRALAAGESRLPTETVWPGRARRRRRRGVAHLRRQGSAHDASADRARGRCRARFAAWPASTQPLAQAFWPMTARAGVGGRGGGRPNDDRLARAGPPAGADPAASSARAGRARRGRAQRQPFRPCQRHLRRACGAGVRPRAEGAGRR
jgi:5-(carboxyamino)imidazole ribonucleotide synthase